MAVIGASAGIAAAVEFYKPHPVVAHMMDDRVAERAEIRLDGKAELAPFARPVGIAQAIRQGKGPLPCQRRRVIPAGLGGPTGGKPQAEVHAQALDALEEGARAVGVARGSKARQVRGRVHPAGVKCKIVQAHPLRLPPLQHAQHVQRLLVVEGRARAPIGY